MNKGERSNYGVWPSDRPRCLISLNLPVQGHTEIR